MTELFAKLDAIDQSYRQAKSVQSSMYTRDQLRDLLSLLPVGVLIIGRNGKVADANPVAIELLGTPLINEAWVSIIQRSFLPRADDGMEVSLQSGKRVQIATRAMSDGDGQLIVISDLSETRSLQERLARKNRLAGVGQMMASLAHQLRTPITTAILSAHALKGLESKYDTSAKHSDRLLERLEYMERQISDMLLVAGGGTPTVEKLNLYTVLKELVKNYEAIAKKSGIQIKFNADGNEHTVIGNHHALVGAFSNVIENAIDALPTAKNIAAPTAPSVLQSVQAIISVNLTLADSEVKVSIVDNGVGLSPAALKKLQEPFFTTKAKGTGLGLAVVRSVCDAHRAALSISSVMGQGSRFDMVFPRALPVMAAPLKATA